MINMLISLLIAILVIALVLWLILWIIKILPIDARFEQIARTVAIVLACLMVILRALPLLGVAV